MCWRGVAQGLAVQPEQGLEVICSGSLTTFAGQSRYQLVVQSMAPAGAGALMALLDERRKKLQAEGLFDADRKKPLPYLPQVIGVVTSPSGAVIRDILHRLSDRFPRHVLVWPVRVQGESCAAEVAQAIDGFNQLTGEMPRPDLIIVARGGGSLEDLWGFNEESVVRAVARSTIPIISAIGHETDTTLIDYVADQRAPTPTAAAEMAVPVRSELRTRVVNHQHRLEQSMHRLLQQARMQTNGLARGLPRPSDLLAAANQTVDMLAARLTQALSRFADQGQNRLALLAQRLSPRLIQEGLNRHYHQKLDPLSQRLAHALISAHHQAALAIGPIAGRLQPRLLGEVLRPRQIEPHARAQRLIDSRLSSARDRLAGLARQLDLVSHQSVLARGFALVRDESGRALRDADQLAPQARIHIQTAQGSPFWARREPEGKTRETASKGDRTDAVPPSPNTGPQRDRLENGGKAPRRTARKPVPPSDQGDLF